MTCEPSGEMRGSEMRSQSSQVSRREAGGLRAGGFGSAGHDDGDKRENGDDGSWKNSCDAGGYGTDFNMGRPAAVGQQAC